MLYTATVTGVTARTVTRKRDQKTITIYDVTDNTGVTNSTSRRDLANEANRLLNQLADIQVRVEQNGSFENRYLEDVKAATGLPRQAPLPEPTQQPQPQQALPVPVQSAPEQITMEGQGTPKDWSIWRQTASKVAVHMSETPAEFWFNTRQLITFYATGLEPDLPQAGVTSYAPAAQAQQASQQNEFIPEDAYDPGREAPLPDDSDIPF